MGRDVWDSEKRISGPIFKDLPVLVLSGTEDKIIVPEIHNQLYAAAAHLENVPPVSDDNWDVTGSGLKVLVETESGHIDTRPLRTLLENTMLSDQEDEELLTLQRFIQEHIVGNTKCFEGPPPTSVRSVPSQWVNYAWLIPSLLIAMWFMVSYIRKTFTVEVVHHADPIAAIV